MNWLSNYFAHSSVGTGIFPRFFKTDENGKPVCSMCDARAHVFRRNRASGILKPLCPQHLQQGMEWLIDHRPQDFSSEDYVSVSDGQKEWEVQAIMAS